MSSGLEVKLDAAVAAAYPGHACGFVRVVAAKNVAAKDGAIEELAGRYRTAPQAAAAAAEYWQQVYASMGAKPKYASSVARLRDMAEQARDASLGIPVPLVQLYCWFSLVTGVPMAGYRPGALTGPLRLTCPPPGTPFTALGQARGSLEKTKPREVAYVDDEKAICRYWNYRDCDQTKLVPEQADVLFVLDLVGDQVSRFGELAADLRDLLVADDVTTALLTGEQPQARMGSAT